jgi:hypothetical protein
VLPPEEELELWPPPPEDLCVVVPEEADELPVIAVPDGATSHHLAPKASLP